MALTAGRDTGAIFGTMGQYATVKCQFVSDTMLTGETVDFNPALFIQNANIPSPSVLAWRLRYPSGSGVYPMNFYGNDLSKNYEVDLIVYDAYTFAIELKFFFIKDLNSYLYNQVPNNSNIFDANPSTSAYNATNKNIGLRVTVGNESAVCAVPVQANPFCTDAINFDTSNYSIGQDLDINIVSFDSGISNNFFAGFYNESSVTNTSSFVTDLALSYAAISNGASNVDNLPNPCISNGTGFQYSGGLATSLVTIDGSCFAPNQSYRLYIVYQQNGEWKSCISSTIVEGAPPRDAIVGDIDCTIVDGQGNTYNECCVNGIPTCVNVDVCVTLDSTSYDAALSASGFSGNLVDRFQYVNSFITQSVPTDPNSIGGSPTPSVTNITANGIESCVTIEANNSGVYYVVFQFVTFFIEDGTSDYLNFVVQLGFDGNIIDLPYTSSTASGDNIDNNFCLEIDEPITVTFDNMGASNCELLQSIDGVNYEAANVISYDGEGAFVLDPSTVNVGTTMCYKTCCIDPSGGVTPCNCSIECGEIDITVAQDTCLTLGSITKFNPTITVNNINSIDIDTINVLIYDTANTVSLTLNESGNNIATTLTDIPTQTDFTLVYEIVVTLLDGCVFTIPNIAITTPNGDQNTVACFDSVRAFYPATDCSCTTTEPEDICADNVAFIDGSCNQVNGDITVTGTESFVSPVDVDEMLCSSDGGLTFAPCSGVYQNEVLVQRNVSFTDDCPDISLSQLYTCEVDTVCQNSATIAHNISGGVLTITPTTNFNSVVDTETIYVSLDGGITFVDYVSPISLVGGESIIAYLVAEFTDGCPDVTSNTIVDTYSVECNYTGYFVECAYDEIAGTYSATFTGDESMLTVNEKLYSVDGSDPVTPYPGAVTGTVFVVKWIIALPGCPETTFVSACANCEVTGDCFEPGNSVDSTGC